MEGGYKITNIQKPVDYNCVEPKLELIDLVREATLKKIGDYFKNRGILIDDLSNYLRKPTIYHGKSTGLNQIIEWFVDLAVSEYIEEIKTVGLSIKYVINTVKENLFQGGWNVKRRSNIIMAIGGVYNTKKVVSTSEVDETSRLLIVKNNGHKVRLKSKSKSKSKIPSKKKRKEVKSGRKHLCKQCGVNIKCRAVKGTTHINISQNPTHHRFCSKECKTAWIYDLLNKKSNPEMEL